jgi:hypothetical protein
MKKNYFVIILVLLFCFGIAGLYLNHLQTGIALDEATGGCGPCLSWFSDRCGSATIPANTCKLIIDGACAGDCPNYCPQGGKFEYCAGLIGGCAITIEFCNLLEVRYCRPYAYPSRCQCSRGTGGNCGARSDCSK